MTNDVHDDVEDREKREEIIGFGERKPELALQVECEDREPAVERERDCEFLPEDTREPRLAEARRASSAIPTRSSSFPRAFAIREASTIVSSNVTSCSPAATKNGVAKPKRAKSTPPPNGPKTMPAANIAPIRPNARARSLAADEVRDVRLRDADVSAGDALEDARDEDHGDRCNRDRARDVRRKAEHRPADRRADLADDQHGLAADAVGSVSPERGREELAQRKTSP